MSELTDRVDRLLQYLNAEEIPMSDLDLLDDLASAGLTLVESDEASLEYQAQFAR